MVRAKPEEVPFGTPKDLSQRLPSDAPEATLYSFSPSSRNLATRASKTILLLNEGIYILSACKKNQ